jgi:micrococcal nuclease
MLQAMAMFLEILEMRDDMGTTRVKVLLRLGILVFCSLIMARWVTADPTPREARVRAVLDGDTILLDTGEKVRYLGIDAPELSHDDAPGDCYGREALEVNKKWVFHKTVQLRYDSRIVDDYGRLLAYVHLPDGICVNAELLRSGYAYIYRSAEGFERLNEFLSIQRQALKLRTGMWGNCQVKPEAYYNANGRSYIFHRPACQLGKAISQKNLKRFNTRWQALEDAYRPCRRCKP